MDTSSPGAELEEFRLIDASADEKHMAFTIHMDRTPESWAL